MFFKQYFNSDRTIKNNALRRKCLFIAMLAIVMFSKDIVAEQKTTSYSESQIKVAIIYKLLHFIEWPPHTKLTLCVYEPNAVDVSSFGFMPMQTESGNLLDVEFFHKNGSPVIKDYCTMIFISNEAHTSIKKILFDDKNSASLTIGETDQFIRQGGMINLVKKDSTLKFEINLSALKHAGIGISSQLLRIADQVYTEQNSE
jgi:hypothetical protein